MVAEEACVLSAPGPPREDHLRSDIGHLSASLVELYQRPTPERLGAFDKSLFAKIGRYQVMFGLAPHIDSTDVVKLTAALREDVEEVLRFYLLGHGGGNKMKPSTTSTSPQELGILEGGSGAAGAAGVINNSCSTSTSKTSNGFLPFDPLQVREWCKVRLGVLRDEAGVIGELEWTDEQRDYMYAAWDLFSTLADEEAETIQDAPKNAIAAPPKTGAAVFRRRGLQPMNPIEEDEEGFACAICPPEETWEDRWSTKIAALQTEHQKLGCDLRDIERKLEKRNNFIDAVMESTAQSVALKMAADEEEKVVDLTNYLTAGGEGAVEKNDSPTSSAMSTTASLAEAELVGGAGAGGVGVGAAAATTTQQEQDAPKQAEAPVRATTPSATSSFSFPSSPGDIKIVRDLLILSDHLHILLPDLARRIAEELKPLGVSIIPRVAPHVSQQYRGEQKDFFLLEHMRRIKFERESFFEELVETKVGGDSGMDAGSGLMIAKCGAGCACGAKN
eukprot:CAMPEP_0179009550 /NCGR_PEP_ID=MMETSP0795-20121207/16332_1 /TAXON_ID=88552 /ORGANISM="Amoebophrya sp., Strain Ameob2" /LENGTH=503 /DNA_ID=CAMNT_0020704755 /DNA_START=160 /DNA_END=1671 /DNA_ORIENTATION=-